MSAVPAIAAAPMEESTVEGIAVEGITVEEYYTLCERGAFGDQRVELLDGVVEFLLSESRYHNAIVQLLLRLLRPFEDEGFFSYTSTVEIDRKNAPEPDVFLCRTPFDEARPEDGMQKPTDVSLVVEVSVSTLAKDRGVKVRKYAGAAIPEYWIVDADARRVEILRDPDGDAYRTVEIVGEDGEIRPLFAPERALPVSRMLPKNRTGGEGGTFPASTP